MRSSAKRMNQPDLFFRDIFLETRESATTSLRTFSMSWPSTESGKSGVTNRDVNVIHGISLTRAKVGTRKFHELTREQVQVRAIFSPLASLQRKLQSLDDDK